MTDAPIPGLEHAFDVEVVLGALEDHGETRRGHRRVVPIVGGSVRGLFDAEILAGRRRLADRAPRRDDRGRRPLHRADARWRAHPDPRDRASAAARPRCSRRCCAASRCDPSAYYFRTVVTLEAAAPEHADLQRAIFVASAVRTADRVTYSAYRVT